MVFDEASPVLHFCRGFKYKHNLYDIRKYKTILVFVYVYLLWEADLSACFLIDKQEYLLIGHRYELDLTIVCESIMLPCLSFPVP